MDKAQFLQKIAEAEKPVVVDFWASWCKPCMVTKPALEKLAKEFEGKIDFLPVNADDSRELLEQFRVYGIPMIIAFRGGKEVGRVMGAHGEYGYRAIFESLAAGREVRFPLTSLDRILRVGANLLLLDEISEGLAPVIVQALKRLVRQLKARGFTVVIAEQNLRFAAPLADRFLVMEHGRVIDHFAQHELASRRGELEQLLNI